MSTPVALQVFGATTAPPQFARRKRTQPSTLTIGMTIMRTRSRIAATFGFVLPVLMTS